MLVLWMDGTGARLSSTMSIGRVPRLYSLLKSEYPRHGPFLGRPDGFDRRRSLAAREAMIAPDHHDADSGATRTIRAVDLFCGAGGLTHGLIRAGVRVDAGVDADPQASFAYEKNNDGARFLPWDVTGKNAPSVAKLFGGSKDDVRLLAGCAPCQPFSKLNKGEGESHASWGLLHAFSRFVKGIEPQLVTMENVPELTRRGEDVFRAFVRSLESLDYQVDWRIVQCADYGVPQSRRRLVLLASRLGPISVPEGDFSGRLNWHTVRSTIEDLPPLGSGAVDAKDPLHAASKLSERNLERIRSTPLDGGSRDSWPRRLELDCHRKTSGRKYVSIYGRMWWDRPAPTVTTLCTGLGNGRFGHPVQDRAISLREAALLQGFPPGYRFWHDGQKPPRKSVARMIGNAVPPPLGEALGKALVSHVAESTASPSAF